MKLDLAAPPTWLLVAAIGAAWAIGAALLVPRIIAALPADFFIRPAVHRSRAVRVSRWALGSAVVAAGLAMLVLPGPGVVGIVVGLVILDLPILRRVLARLLRRKTFGEAVNRIRKNRGKPPLEVP